MRSPASNRRAGPLGLTTGAAAAASVAATRQQTVAAALGYRITRDRWRAGMADAELALTHTK